MKKKTLVIDMDDVIVVEHFLGLINEYTNKNLKESDFKNYYMQDDLEDKSGFFKFYLTKNIYDYGHISDGAIEVIKELCEHYDVFIGTSFIVRDIINDSGIFVKYKYDFLIKYFPFINPMNFIFLGNKSIIKCDIMIDDKEENLKCGKKKLLYTSYHNKDINDDELKRKRITRVNDWKDISLILLGGKNAE